MATLKEQYEQQIDADSLEFKIVGEQLMVNCVSVDTITLENNILTVTLTNGTSVTGYVKGDQGIQGIQGPKGDQGIQGIQGPKGDQGIQGDTGKTGLTGATGPKGDQGLKGDTGAKGDKGDPGISFSAVVVTALPATGKDNTLYLVAHSSSTTGDLYNEYMWINSSSSYELIGSTQIDLTDINTAITNLQTLTTQHTSSINTLNTTVSEHNTRMGALSDLTTTVKTSLVNAMNSLVTTITTIQNNIGSLTALNTTAKTSVVAAINEVSTKLSTSILVIKDIEINNDICIPDITYSDFRYRVDIYITDCLADHVPDVYPTLADAKLFCPIAETEDGVVHVWLKNNTFGSITIPTIKLTKGVQVL